MTRDVTWRPIEPKPAPRKTGRRLALVALVAINVGVVLYHGDPREHAREAVAPSERPESPTPTRKAAPAPEGTQPTSTSLQATETDAETTTESALAAARAVASEFATEASPERAGPPAPSGYNPLAGMRSPERVQRVEEHALRRGQSVAAALMAVGVASETAAAAVSSMRPHVDFRRLRPGDRFKVRFDAEDHLVSLDVRRGLGAGARADLHQGQWQAAPLKLAVDRLEAEISGTIVTSLWEAMVGAGESPRLVHDMVEIFAWDLDFYSEVFPQDTFRLLVEKRFIEGQFFEYGPVLAAEFVSDGHVHRAFMHRAGERVSYYDAGGNSMRKQLLKTPLAYGRVTSGFGKRRHPVLGYTRAHNGIDYGVPTGTPVWTVGDGRVVRAGFHGGFGRLVEVKHPNGWVSQYAHLSKIRVRVGQKVVQKQVIGNVGSTGLATGPHLHYGLRRHGAYVNPLVQRFERGRRLTGAELAAFQERVAQLEVALDNIRVAHLGRPASEG